MRAFCFIICEWYLLLEMDIFQKVYNILNSCTPWWLQNLQLHQVNFLSVYYLTLRNPPSMIYVGGRLENQIRNFGDTIVPPKYNQVNLSGFLVLLII